MVSELLDKVDAVAVRVFDGEIAVAPGQVGGTFSPWTRARQTSPTWTSHRPGTRS